MDELRVTCEKIHHLHCSYFHWCLSKIISRVFGACICSIRAGNWQVIISQLVTETGQYFKKQVGRFLNKLIININL